MPEYISHLGSSMVLQHWNSETLVFKPALMGRWSAVNDTLASRNFSLHRCFFYRHQQMSQYRLDIVQRQIGPTHCPVAFFRLHVLTRTTSNAVWLPVCTTRRLDANSDDSCILVRQVTAFFDLQVWHESLVWLVFLFIFYSYQCTLSLSCAHAL